MQQHHGVTLKTLLLRASSSISRRSISNSRLSSAAAPAVTATPTAMPSGGGPGGGGADPSLYPSWDIEQLVSCAARKQVRVSLDTVLELSTGKRPWRSFFGEPSSEWRSEKEFSARAVADVTRAERARGRATDPGAVAGGVEMIQGQLQSAQYLHRELPVRLASAVLELDKASPVHTCGTVVSDCCFCYSCWFAVCLFVCFCQHMVQPCARCECNRWGAHTEL